MADPERDFSRSREIYRCAHLFGCCNRRPLRGSGASRAFVRGGHRRTLSVSASKAKQAKSQFGPLNSLVVSLDTAYTPPFTPNATQTVISFSRDFVFSPGGLPQCNLSAINTVPQAQADAICGSSKVGTGSAMINAGLLTGVVSAYNGTPSGGTPTIGLHVDIFTSTGSYAFSTTLTGVLNAQANSLTIAIPPPGRRSRTSIRRSTRSGRARRRDSRSTT